MKNLYRILSSHYSPKDGHDSIMGYIICENEEQVFDVMKDSLKFDYKHSCIGWIGDLEEDDGYYIDDDLDRFIECTHKERILAEKGELRCDEYLEDLYYGQTLYGWELAKENLSESEIETLTSLKIAKTV